MTTLCLFAAAAPFAAPAQPVASPVQRPVARAAAPIWAVDPARAGPDLPPAGRSLFDFAVTREIEGHPLHDVPFPFAALVKRIETRAGCAKPCAKQVLVPLGRSLQRTAAAPAFFEFPRVVTAIDVEPAFAGAALLKDRVYLGYQEKNDLVEVISYNEAAGRFEFQVVRDYRAGGARQVVYARRAVCATCHQNLAPIFSRQVWEETNANPRIAARLQIDARQDYQGVPIRRGVDIPNAIDAATDRANLLAVAQLLWRTGCGDGAAGARCRAAAFLAALQYRLTDERAFDELAPAWREAFLPSLTREWRAQWPAGLAIPNPDIPNRDPLPPDGVPQPRGLAASHVPAAFEPLAPRGPLAVWTGEDPQSARAFIAALAGMIAAADIRALDEQLAARAARERPSARRYEAPCEMAWSGSTVRFKCVGSGDAPLRVTGRLELAGARIVGGEIGALEAGGAAPLEYLAVAAGTFDSATGRATIAPTGGALRARLADGAAIGAIALAWNPAGTRLRADVREASATAALVAIDDFAPVRDAVAALAAETPEDTKGREAAADAPFAPRAFGRARVLPRLFAKLGISVPDWCCEDDSRLPPPVVEAPEPAMRADGAAQPFAAFYPLCASCHATAERFPPNFLAGSPDRVAASVKHCAPRIYARLALWQVAPAAREKSPMPPPIAATRREAYEAPASLGGLERAAAELVRAESGAAPRLATMLADGYESLRPCLP